MIQTKTKPNSVVEQPIRARTTVHISIFVTLSAEVHEQKFRLGGQSDAKPPVFSPQKGIKLQVHNKIRYALSKRHKQVQQAICRSSKNNKTTVT
ncbi:hypothetical protein TNCV_1675961 [Trichonephila clavipes]|nr:hypothetical protein TNCV_1675961 [Trichonephila clavipes]